MLEYLGYTVEATKIHPSLKAYHKKYTKGKITLESYVEQCDRVHEAWIKTIEARDKKRTCVERGHSPQNIGPCKCY